MSHWIPQLSTPPKPEVAASQVLKWLREQCRPRRRDQPLRVSLGQFLQATVLDANAEERERQRDPRNGAYIATAPDLTTNTEPYFAVVWDLVRHGMLAPVPARRPDAQIEYRDEFVVTARAIRWLTEGSQEVILPLEHQRFADALKRHSAHFGPVYLQRAIEALGCYHAQCYYAACVMAGAAAEAILVGLATEKSGDRVRVQRKIDARSGRQELHKLLRPKSNGTAQRRVETLMELVAYYRDDAAHTSADPIDEETAEFVLLTLLNIATFADREWGSLTTRAPSPGDGQTGDGDATD